MKTCTCHNHSGDNPDCHFHGEGCGGVSFKVDEGIAFKADDTPSCEYCGGSHTYLCPRIKIIEYYPDGAVKQIEFRQDWQLPLSFEEMERRQEEWYRRLRDKPYYNSP